MSRDYSPYRGLGKARGKVVELLTLLRNGVGFLHSLLQGQLIPSGHSYCWVRTEATLVNGVMV